MLRIWTASGRLAANSAEKKPPDAPMSTNARQPEASFKNERHSSASNAMERKTLCASASSGRRKRSERFKNIQSTPAFMSRWMRSEVSMR